MDLKITVTAILAATLLSSPVLAQTKTKDKTEEDSVISRQAIIADAREFCDRVASNDESVVDALAVADWEPQVDSFGAAPYYHEIEGAKDYPGVGRAEIWGFVELYPSHIIGYCTFEIPEPEIAMPVEELNGIDGLTGGVEHRDDGVYTSLSNDEAPYHKFILARQTADSFYYQITDVIERE